MICWLNGKLLATELAHIAITDRGFLLGDGIYETIRVARGEAQCLSRHLARLHMGAQLIGMQHIDVDLEAAISAVLHANQLQRGAVRITLTRGSGPRGLVPPAEPVLTYLVTAFPSAPPLQPACVIIANRTRRNEHSPLARVKSLNCLDNIIARLEAKNSGADDALLINTSGRIAEATAANIFAVIDGKLVTPPLSDGCLPGITRVRILEAGAREVSLTPEALVNAQEVFLTTSLGIRPICELAGRALPQSMPISAQLTQLLFHDQ